MANYVGSNKNAMKGWRLWLPICAHRKIWRLSMKQVYMTVYCCENLGYVVRPVKKWAMLWDRQQTLSLNLKRTIPYHNVAQHLFHRHRKDFDNSEDPKLSQRAVHTPILWLKRAVPLAVLCAGVLIALFVCVVREIISECFFLAPRLHILLLYCASVPVLTSLFSSCFNKNS